MSSNFLQSEEWSNFWAKSNNENHKIYNIKAHLKSKAVINTGVEEYSTKMFLYPWKFNQTWLYIPRLGSGFFPSSKKEAKLILKDIVNQSLAIGKGVRATLLKIDFDEEFYFLLVNNESFNQSQEESHAKYLTSLVSQQIVDSPRQINFLSTIVLNISEVKLKPNTSPDISSAEIKNFYQNNLEFWGKVNQNIRRYTKKSLDLNWTIEIDKSNFEEWYEIHYATAKRQQFATHTKSYLKELFNQEFAHSIILRDNNKIAQSVWLGGVFEDTIVYLHGGNTSAGFAGYGQYLIHLTAIYLGKLYGCVNYDLGGWEEGKGFSKFKEGYKGKIVKYPGAFDLVLKEPDYFLTRLSQWFKKRG